jgi:glycerophosphoryl diester phosphodiesterase
LNESSVKNLAGVKIFAWTVNDEKRLRELEKLGIVAVATDLLGTPSSSSALQEV